MEYDTRIGLRAAILQFWVNRLAAGLDLIDVYTCDDESQTRVGLQAANLQLWVNRLAAEDLWKGKC